MAFWRRTEEGPADAAARRMRRAPGDRVMAAAVDVTTGSIVVGTVQELVVLAPDGTEVRRRRWLDVDAGSWESTTGSVSVTWVDGSRGTQWMFGPEERKFPEVFRDRVEASRVIDTPVVDEGRTIGRAAIRKDLRTGELVPQLLYERRIRRDDAMAHLVGERALADLEEQAGL
ncbi:hypothetical protein [Mobilicoccus pelagius]|uniref:Uncharacterized protein n=1 Tax=Mobilicoccus pelagius NBRC 104925 TaxID=1089455 RepID=H5UPY8_9MICO|nr:hypothetical protein [Mobilicoccus pelagius]GAB47793.1 hypothetical protein MOPEL_029_00730 [Mobilicoccus pelagius NBRC 104925]